MASVTHQVTTTDTGNLTNVTTSFTPAANELLVVFTTVEGNTADRTLTSSVGGQTFTQIRKQVFRTSADALYLHVSNALTTNASQTVQVDGSGSGSIISVYSVSGITVLGAVANQGGQSNGTAATAPAPVFGQAARTENPCLSCVANATNPAGVTNAPGSWTKSQDTGYTTGAITGLASAFRNSGETGTTITWGTNSASIFASIVVEIDISPNPPDISIARYLRTRA